MKKTNMKKYVISLGSVAMVAMPVVAAVSCSTTDSPYVPGAGGVNLNNISGTLAHSLFRSNAIKVGDKMSLNINGKTYTATWTQENADAEVSASEPADLFEIVIQDFLALPDAPSRADIVTALGDSAAQAGHHGSSLSMKAPSQGIDFTGVANNREFWHQYFRTEWEKNLGSDNIKAGTQITLSISDELTIVTTWTADDVAEEAKMDANQLVDYVALKFAGTYANTLAHATLDTSKQVTDSHGVTTTQKVVFDEKNPTFASKVEEVAPECLKEVVEAMGGESSSSHHTYVRAAGDEAHPVDLTAPFSRGNISPNTTLWHALFRFEQIEAAEDSQHATHTTHGTFLGTMKGREYYTNQSTDGENFGKIKTPGTLVKFEWTEADATNEDRCNQDDLFDYLSARFTGASEAESFKYAKGQSSTVVATDAQSVRTSFGVDIKAGHHNVPVGKPSTPEADAAFDFTNMINDRTTWHHAFRGDGDNLKTNIGAGSIIKLRVMGTDVFYTWTSQDVATEANLGPEALQEYVANKFFQAAEGEFTLEQVKAAMGYEYSSSSHHTYPAWGFVNGTWDLTAPLARDWKYDAAALKPQYSANTTIWHDMFRLEYLTPGQVIQMNVVSIDEHGISGNNGQDGHVWSENTTTHKFSWQSGVTLSFTWTALDASNEDALNQDDLFDYVARRLMGKTETVAFNETKANTPLDSTLQTLTDHKIDPSHGANSGVSGGARNQVSESLIRTNMAVDSISHHGVGTIVPTSGGH